MTYSAKDVADFVVWTAINNSRRITHLKLQKVLYFLQAYNLYEKKNALFSEGIEKWKFGPVVPEVYQEYKIFGAKEIQGIPDKVTFDEEFNFEITPYDVDDSPIVNNDKTRLEPVILSLLNYDEFDLVERTHLEDLWKKDKPAIEMGVRNIKYNKTEMREFFEINEEERLWQK
jgi:uncharacterized phage-associated protein